MEESLKELLKEVKQINAREQTKSHVFWTMNRISVKVNRRQKELAERGESSYQESIEEKIAVIFMYGILGLSVFATVKILWFM